MRELHINKKDIRDTKLVDVPLAPLAAGAARLKALAKSRSGASAQ